MRIVLTGGGSAGHFYPLIAIAEEINHMADAERLVRPEIYYMSTSPYDKKDLFDNGITFIQVTAGKRRIYFSPLNFIDYFKMAWGSLKALFLLYRLYPDVIISKGGYAAFPALISARILNIPVVIHESDAHPGRVNMWAGKFAYRIGVSWPQAAEHFPKDKVAHTGQPVRGGLSDAIQDRGFEYLKIDPKIPTILVLGGSQGAQVINDAIMDSLPGLLPKYQIIHQTGIKNEKISANAAKVVLGPNHPHLDRYRTYGYMTSMELRMAAGVASLVISRAGSTIFEIASWALPSIIIPITSSNGDHQRKNAFSYAREGGCVVVEEKNLTPHLLAAEIDKILTNPELYKKMSDAARAFYKDDAAKVIAKEAVTIGLRHENN